MRVMGPSHCPDSSTQCAPVSNDGGACFDGGGSLPKDSVCNMADDMCGPGLTCISVSGNSLCKEWCKPARGNADCSSGDEACVEITYTVTLGNETREIDAYGICM